MSASADEVSQSEHIHFFKELFNIEKSHQKSIYEICLPTEQELKDLITLTLINTTASEWPDNKDFDNELTDCLQYNFREQLLAKLKQTKQPPSDIRSRFYQQYGKKIATDTFVQVIKEYQAATGFTENPAKKPSPFL
ncbi:hypothetical protein [Marinomonas transparens]|uniref:Uncharacterized protein n=1 Tax=Marinomonas transparens TaxID=2795388 RepID=A0A934N070_9GAMM|nr:hypothetical protein [Marinomonas transparens]MBJ7538270.1 hypothetical protein [Marinomonas transparens]